MRSSRGGGYDPKAWAEKQKAAKEKAARLRAERKARQPAQDAPSERPPTAGRGRGGLGGNPFGSTQPNPFGQPRNRPTSAGGFGYSYQSPSANSIRSSTSQNSNTHLSPQQRHAAEHAASQKRSPRQPQQQQQQQRGAQVQDDALKKQVEEMALQIRELMEFKATVERFMSEQDKQVGDLWIEYRKLKSSGSRSSRATPKRAPEEDRGSSRSQQRSNAAQFDDQPVGGGSSGHGSGGAGRFDDQPIAAKRSRSRSRGRRTSDKSDQRDLDEQPVGGGSGFGGSAFGGVGGSGKGSSSFDDEPIGGRRNQGFDDQPVGAGRNQGFDDQPVGGGGPNPVEEQPVGQSTFDVPEDGPAVKTKPCPKCGRKFNATALKKHIKLKICQKKRREFKVKVVDEEVPAHQRSKTPPKPKGPPKWKQDRDRLREAMKAGKMLAKAMKDGVDLSTLPPPPTSKAPDDRTPCPHCGRKFNDTAAQRHIPLCAKKAKAQPRSRRR